MKQKGYPVYSEDELGMIAQVASGTDCTGLEPTPPESRNQSESYGELYNVPFPSCNGSPQSNEALQDVARTGAQDLADMQQNAIMPHRPARHNRGNPT